MAKVALPKGAKAPSRGKCPASHPVKGNMDSMLFHSPESPNFDATVAEVCFETEADAKAAGFKKPKAVAGSAVKNVAGKAGAVVKGAAKAVAKAVEKPAAKAASKPTAKATEKAPAKSAVKPAAKIAEKATAKPAAKAPAKGAEKAPAKSAAKAAEKAPAKSAAKPAEKAPARSAAKPAEKAPAKSAAKPAEKAPAKTAAKPAEKAPAKPAAKPAEKAAAVTTPAAGITPAAPAEVAPPKKRKVKNPAPKPIAEIVLPKILVATPPRTPQEQSPVPMTTRSGKPLPKHSVAPRQGAAGEFTCPGTHPIKGNESSRLYHLPSSPSYNLTVAEFCFRSEEEAQDAGFTPAPR